MPAKSQRQFMMSASEAFLKAARSWSADAKLRNAAIFPLPHRSPRLEKEMSSFSQSNGRVRRLVIGGEFFERPLVQLDP